MRARRDTAYGDTQLVSALRSVRMLRLALCIHLSFAWVVLALRLSAQQPQPADLIVTGARIYTVDDARPVADAMAVRGRRVVFVGSERGALALKGASTRVLELPGRTIVPGITDAHGHLLGLGRALTSVDLVGTKSYQEVIARVAARAKEVQP